MAKVKKGIFVFVAYKFVLLRLRYNAQNFSFYIFLVMSFANYYIKFCGQITYNTLYIILHIIYFLLVKISK